MFNSSYQNVISIPVPEDTDTYEALTNKAYIELVKNGIKTYNMEVVNEQYQLAEKNKVMVFKFDINNYSEGNELSLQIAGINSYNKTRRAKLGIGATVAVCSNGMVSAEYGVTELHTKGINNKLSASVISYLGTAVQTFEELQLFAETIKNQKINSNFVYFIIGNLITNDIITKKQVDIIKNELRNSKDFPYNGTAWNFYNNITEALKVSRNYISAHYQTHQLFQTQLI